MSRGGLAYRNSWTLDARVGRRTLDAGLWTLDSGRWTLDTGYWTLDAGLWALHDRIWMLDSKLWTLDSGRWPLDVKTLKLKNIQCFGNNGSILITSFLNSTLINIFCHFSHEIFSVAYSFQVTLSNHQKYQKPEVFISCGLGRST